MAPVFFLSHGSPMRAIETSPASDFLVSLGRQLTQLKGLVVISPHWETQAIEYTASGNLTTIHDFYGFPDALYNVEYDVNNPQWLSDLLADNLTGYSKNVKSNKRGLDHGAWSVLSLMFPEKKLPIIGLSLPRNMSLLELYQFGQHLKALRDQGVAVVTTGMATHNLSELSYAGKPDQWAISFVDWLQEKVGNRDIAALFDYVKLAPNAKRSHPRDEHLRPLFIALGAAGNSKGKLIHDSWELANANNSSWSWG